MEWEIGAECLACVLIVLVLCFSREKFYTQMPQTRLYYACLGFALFSTLLNIATVVLMGVPGLLPRWLCYTLNMLYFTFFPLLEAALTYYMAYLIHGRGPCFTRVAICLGVMLAAAGMAAAGGMTGAAMALAAVLVFLRYRAVAQKQFGGISGDLAGCFLQKAELWMLAALAACSLLSGVTG